LLTIDELMKIELKAFHAEIINDQEELQKEKQVYLPIPIIRNLDPRTIGKNYLQIKYDVKDMIHTEIDRILRDPLLAELVIKEKG
jgi:hypothetical protein